MSILVLNCGSSSIKYRLLERTKIEVIAGGVVEKIGEPDPKITHFWNETKVSKNIEVSDHKDALMCIKDLLFNPTVGVLNRTSEVLAVGHRVVHGGERFVNSVIITDEVEKIIDSLSSKDRVNLITVERQSKKCFDEASFNHSEVLAYANSLQPSFTNGDLNQAIFQAERQLKKSGGRGEIYFISDF